MTKTESIAVKPAPGIWVARVGGAVIAESARAMELAEDGHNPVIYFPQTDIAMAFLEPSADRSSDPRRGSARYFGIATKSALIENAAWSYDEPSAALDALKDHVAFYPGSVAVERI